MACDGYTHSHFFLDGTFGLMSCCVGGMFSGCTPYRGQGLSDTDLSRPRSYRGTGSILALPQHHGCILTGAAFPVSVLWDDGMAIRWQQWESTSDSTSSIVSLQDYLAD